MPKPFRVDFRADASEEIGLGHVMRCLTLADALSARGSECRLIFRALPGHLAEHIEARGHRPEPLPVPVDAIADPDVYGTWLGVSRVQDAADCSNVLAQDPPDILVVDHYALDASWERAVCPQGTCLVALDDLANRPHACNIFLDQNLGRHDSDYDTLLPADCLRLIGPNYALLRPQFAMARKEALARRTGKPCHQLLISMGGMDKSDATSKMLLELAEMHLPTDFAVCVVMGSASTNLDRVRKIAAQMPFATEVLFDVADMAPLMATADLAIGGAGSTSWERCCLGLPTLLLTIADNQRSIAQALHNSDAAFYVGDVRESGWTSALRAALSRAVQQPEWLFGMAKTASAICDGRGAERVADAMFEIVQGEIAKGHSV